MWAHTYDPVFCTRQKIHVDGGDRGSFRNAEFNSILQTDVPETQDFNFIFTRLIVREDFIVFSRRERILSYLSSQASFQ